VRYVITILGVLVLAAGLGGLKYRQISGLIASGKEMAKMGPPPESVATALAEDQVWEDSLTAVGSIAAARGVAVSNDAPGVVAHISFESGAFVREGQVLLELDSSVEKAQLASARARRNLAEITAKRTRALVDTASIARAQADTDDATLETASMDANAIQAQIDRKTVKAPFAGRLGIRQVNLGQYLNPGTTLTMLTAIDSVYVDFSLPQQRLADVKVGMPVKAAIEGSEGARDGTIAAIEPDIDATTRTIKLRAAVPNKAEKLRPGMFANITVLLPNKAAVVVVPATAVVHASFGDSVFIVEDKKDATGAVVKGPDGKDAKAARQQFVKIGQARGDFVSIADGVKSGQEIVTAGAFKLRNGAGIVVAKDIGAKPQLDPHPENR
jgi:membrane fusion protein (multidrug efflux system)